MLIKIINNSPLESPEYATVDSAGLDLKANINNPIVLLPLERMLVPTGLIMEIPPGYFGMICPRSGLALKKGLTVINSPGIVDSDFRSQVQVILINLSNNEISIEPGDRIAQIVFLAYEKANTQIVSSVEELSITQRTGGFGSTGVK